MLRKIYQAGHPILRNQSKLVTKNQLAKESTQELIDHMIATLRDVPGVGLAAPQVGESLQIIILDDQKKYHEPIPKRVLQQQGRREVPLTVLVNPKLEILNEEMAVFFEGCLSVDGYLGPVPRAIRVHVKAWDRHGVLFSYVAEGWHARMLQHELDHLQGALYVDRMIPKGFMTAKNFVNLWRDSSQAKILKSFQLPSSS